MAQKRLLSLTLAAAALLSLSACGGDPASSQEDTSQSAPAGVAVQVQEVSADTISAENKVSGRVAADNETSIFVASSAKCTALYVEAGDTVQAGQAICTLDLESTLASYNAANITYESAVQSYQDQKAILDRQVQLAQDNVDNLKALFEIGAASQLEIDQAELSLQQAQAGRASTLAQLEAGMQSSRSNVEQLSTLLEDVDANGNVIAPVSGTLVSLSAVENGYVSPSMPVAVIDGPDQMKVTVSVSEALVPKLAIGDKADVTVSAVDAAVEDGQCPDPAVYGHPVRARRGGRPDGRHVRRRHLPHRHLLQRHRGPHRGHPHQRRRTVRLCGGKRRGQVCGGGHRPDRQRRHRGDLRAERGPAAGDGGPVLPV